MKKTVILCDNPLALLAALAGQHEEELTKEHGGHVKLTGTFRSKENAGDYEIHQIGTVEYNIPTELFVEKIKPLIEEYATRTVTEEHKYFKEDVNAE